jgi:hypothetical protein
METAAERLKADLESELFQHGHTQGFWELVLHEGWFVYVRLLAPDNRSYTVELDCTEYGDASIRGRFVDDQRRCVATAWPRGNATFEQWIKFRDANPFICWDQDRSGIEHHPEWKARRAWARKSNQLVTYLNFQRELMHLPARGYERLNRAA